MNLRELGEQFDSDYFINGIGKRISLYTNFRWLPQVSFPIANAIKKLYPNKIILDFGCAMGFTVYALRLLNVEAYGFDISEYAYKNRKPEVEKYIFKEKGYIPEIDVVFGKDVFEHIPYGQLAFELSELSRICNDALFIVPLGKDNQYRIPEYVFDATHIVIEDEEWWAKVFIGAGFKIKEFWHQRHGLKENWAHHNKYGNGIFMLVSE